jgi:pheromone shutdown-related protein TraB
MNDTQPAPTGGPSDSLPDSVKTASLEGREIYLVGTAHVSKQSVEDVRRAIELIQPDTVAVELCESRYRNIVDRAQWKKTNIAKVIRDGRAMLLLASLIMTSFQRRIGKKLGVTPGAEMVEAIERAQATGAHLVLADRDIQVTLKRTWANLGFFKKLKMLSQLLASLFVAEDIDEQMVEELKKENQLTDILEVLAHEFPLVKGTLIDERDTYLAQMIRSAEGRRIVAVVGAGHVPGILREISLERPLETLRQIPPPTIWPKIIKWGIPVLVVGLLAFGFFRVGTEHSLQSLYIWFLVNGILSALGAALALGHPLTVVSAFLAAPLTSLNPMIAAGWVAGLVQAFVRKPTVADLEDLPEAITSVRGFWRNPVSRILLVVVLSNLGSSLGTFISGGWIAARTLG